MLDRLRLLERRDIDELLILDISATPLHKAPRFDELAELCNNMFCPITYGGGVRSVADVKRALRCGADKVAINTAACECPDLISDAAHVVGSQAIVASMDVKRGMVHTHCGSRDSGRDAIWWAQQCEYCGAGEILLTDIERDGTMQGYNLDLIRSVSHAVSIPVIACGGCGSAEHMRQAVEAGAHAAAAGAMFQFKEVTPKDVARHLDSNGIAARI